MDHKHDSALARKPQDKTDCRTRAEYYRGIDVMRRHVLMHPDATLSAVRIIELLPETTFNFERWQATGFYDAGGQPNGHGITEETIAELCGVSLRSVAPAMKLLARILGMRTRSRRRDFVTQKFEGAKAYHFPTPQETRANTQGLRSGFSEDNALTDNENRERDSEPKTEPTCQTHTQGLRTNLSINFSRKKDSDSAADAAAPLEEGAQESNGGHVNGNAGTTESTTSGTTESAMSDAEKAELGKLSAELDVLESEQERLNRIGCSLTGWRKTSTCAISSKCFASCSTSPIPKRRRRIQGLRFSRVATRSAARALVASSRILQKRTMVTSHALGKCSKRRARSSIRVAISAPSFASGTSRIGS